MHSSHGDLYYKFWLLDRGQKVCFGNLWRFGRHLYDREQLRNQL